ncbi:hypothetical protein PAPHI01_0289 [Pancytospora philotis]|nr:hypothetical protein PAPHI01_0289 [Pancytospora philotis]
MSAGATTHIRLRISVSNAFKFCISIASSSTVADLAALVGDILEKHYRYQLAEFAVRSEDGFDILEQFPLGAVLSDNQIVLVDALLPLAQPNVLRHAPAQAAPLAPKTKQHGAGAAREIGAYYASNSEYLKTQSQLYQERAKLTSTAKAAEPIPASAQIAEVPAQSHSAYNETVPAAETVAAEPVRVDNPETSTAAADKLGAKEYGALVDGSVQFAPNFRGFAVKKKELEKSKFSTATLSAAFRPLKKQKHEEVYESI